MVKTRLKKSTRIAVVPQKKKQAEMTRLGSALRTLGGMGGGALGTVFGMPSSGASVGTGIGAALSRWLGSGDYSVSTNSLVTKASTGVPMMHRDGQTVTVRHKEYIGQIAGSTDFTVQRALQINPGNSVAFPWLSGIARNFQEYKIKGMVYHYIPSSGTAVSSTNAALGTVMIQTSYRANDAPPSSKAYLLNEYWASESVPSESFCHPIECDPKENPFNVQYIRTGTIPSNDSQLLYDLGVTYVATSGMQTTGNTVGDLWVTYEIELKKPIVESNVTSPSPSLSAAFTAPTPTTNFPSTYVSQGEITINSVSAKSITFNAGLSGTYAYNIIVPASTTFTAVDLSGNATLTNAVQAFASPVIGGVYYRTVAAAGTVNSGFYSAAFTVTDSSLPVTVTLPTWAWTGTATYLLLEVVPYNF